jgi:hypothetical protein
MFISTVVDLDLSRRAAPQNAAGMNGLNQSSNQDYQPRSGDPSPQNFMRCHEVSLPSSLDVGCYLGRDPNPGNLFSTALCTVVVLQRPRKCI